MKLAIITDEVSQDLETALRLAARYHLDGVEFRSVWEKPVQHLSAEQVDRVQAMLQDQQLSLAAIASPVFKCELHDEGAQQDNLDYLRSCARIAKQLGTNLVRVFTFWKRGPSAPVWERVKKQFRAAIPIAEEEGIILIVENEHTTYCATAAETQHLVAEIDSPVVKVVWDPCNEVWAEEGITPYPDAYRLVESSVVHVHVKDAERGSEGGPAQHTPVGDGSVDWKGQLVDLLRIGYQGYLSLETHWRPRSLSNAALSQPGGAGFSEAGEYASDLCLRNLLAILADARREAG